MRDNIMAVRFTVVNTNETFLHDVRRVWPLVEQPFNE